MYFFPYQSRVEITFLVHQLIDKESSLQFIRNQDTLLAIDFSVDMGGVTINQNIKGNYLSNPPFYPVEIERLTEVKVKYQSEKSIIYLYFKYGLDSQNSQNSQNSNTNTIKLNVKDFSHTLVVAIGILVSVAETPDGVKTGNDKICQDFVDDCLPLSSFKQITEKLEEKTITKAKFVDILLEAANQNKKHLKKENKKIDNNLSQILKMEEAQTKNKANSNNNLNSKRNIPDKIYIFPENKYSHGVSLLSDGTLQHGTSLGKWLYHNQRLFLFLEGQDIQLFVNNNLISDLNGLKWYISLDDDKIDTSTNHKVNSSLFLTKYGQQIKWIILVITCYKRLPLAKQVNKSWANALKKLGFICFFVVGDPNRPKSEVEGDFLYVKCLDSYEALPSKVFHAYQYCYENFNFTYLYKIDDDTVVNPLKLIQLDLGNHNYIGKPQQVTREFNRYWHRTKCQNKKLEMIPYPSQRIRLGAIYAKGEAGYFLSRFAVSKLLSAQDYICSDLYEDKVIGDVLDKNGIKLHHNSEYQTKLVENFGNERKLDKFCVIMDVGSKIEHIYHHNLQHKVL